MLNFIHKFHALNRRFLNELAIFKYVLEFVNQNFLCDSLGGARRECFIKVYELNRLRRKSALRWGIWESRKREG